MSTFTVSLVKITNVEDIAGFDRIQAAVIGGYKCVVPRGAYSFGDYVFYIPESSIVPQWILETLNLVGALAGSNKNRVKARKFGGMISQGIVISAEQIVKSSSTAVPEAAKELAMSIMYSHAVAETVHNDKTDAAETFGITKYVPEVPVGMAGEVCNIGTDVTLYFDVENIKSFPNVLNSGELVTVTEKLHGTCCQIGVYIPHSGNNPELFSLGDTGMQAFVTTKRFGKNGLAFKNNSANNKNIYVSTLRANLLDIQIIASKYTDLLNGGYAMYIIGEVYGKGVQDLHYGLDGSDFKVFAIAFKNIRTGDVHWLDYATICSILHNTKQLQPIKLLAVMPFDYNKIAEMAEQRSATSSKDQLMEGVVITPVFNRPDNALSSNMTRIALKYVSNNYILRKDKNASEFE